MLIAQISDLHIRPRGVLAYGVVETNASAEAAVNAILRFRPAPDLVLVTGDITDCGLEEEFAIAAELLGRLPMPVYVTPGNHDRRETLRSAFASPGYLPKTGPLNFVIAAPPVRVIALDSLVEGESFGVLSEPTLDFLEESLSAGLQTPTIVMLHHPPALSGIGHMDEIRLLGGAERLEAILRRHPTVERVLCGHHHRAIQHRFGGTICQIAPSVAHQVALDLTPDAPSQFVLEPPAMLVHLWIDGVGLVTHLAPIARAPGPFPFVLPPDYPGRS
jgi:3',5'-cyclic-AMP phosphodiesterase